MGKEYIYIVRAALEPSRCKIGKTNDLERRLREYNSITGISQNNIYHYLFTCEVSDMTAVENAVKERFLRFRELKNREIYLYNDVMFGEYVDFIKSHEAFVQEIFIKVEKQEPIVKIVKKTAPSLKERSLSRKDVMQQAQKTDNDEFYTRREDIEKEIAMYDKSIWKDKVVYCNCDDAVDDAKDERRTSEFALYFLKHFKDLELKKLICTHYGGGVDLFHQGVKGYIFTKYGFSELEFTKDSPPNYDGSFDHPLSLKILNEQADIVCTNPPFSKCVEYWKILIDSGKKFLIISNHTNCVTTAFIPYFMEGKVWAGYNEVLWYLDPKRRKSKASGYWFTNFSITDRPKYKNLKIMPLKDIPDKHKYYDDDGMLVVDNNYIPSNYKHPFAVSVYPIISGVLEKGYKLVQEKQYFPYKNSKKRFGRVLIQKI